MDNIWNELYEAAKAVLKPRAVSKFVEAGGVAAAIESGSGKIYTGVCVDTACTLGICAERNAIFHMLAEGEGHCPPGNRHFFQRRSDGTLRGLPGTDGAAES